MLGSTMGIAAAANTYPAPFVSGGSSDVAIVYGSGQGADDNLAAVSIGSSLSAKIATQSAVTGGVTVTGTGDKLKLEKPSVKLEIGNTTQTVWGTSITKNDLPTLLADQTFRNKQNDESKYAQRIDLGALTFSFFADSDYSNKLPVLGFKVNANTFIANYTIDFVTKPQSVDAADLTDFENRNIVILGKTYYILDFKNGTTATTKMTLLDSANDANIAEGETKTVAVGTNNYDVAIKFIDTDQVILTVNGQDTEKLSATGSTYGTTYKLNDGTYVGIKSVNVQNYAGGVKNVDFSLGKGKLELTDSSTVKLNDVTIDDITSYITLSNSGSKRTIDKIVLRWQNSEKKFLVPGSDLVMPGFEAVKFVMADTTIPDKEITTIEYSGDDVITLKAPLAGGNAEIPILQFDTTTGNTTAVGKSATERLAVTDANTMYYNATSDADSRFVISWANTRDSESHYLKATVTKGDSGANITTFYDVPTGSKACEYTFSGTSGSCRVGNIEVTITGVRYDWRTFNMTLPSGATFNNLYTKDGLKIYLPYSNLTVNGATPVVTTGSSKGAVNVTTTTSFILWFAGKNKDGDLDKEAFNMTLSTSGTTTKRATVSAVQGLGTGYETPASGSKLYEYYATSAVGSKALWDKSNSDQYTAKVEYHGGEVYANLYIAAPSVSSSASGNTVLTLTDSQISDVAKAANLIVVGGSCINTVAASLLGSSVPLCGAGFTTSTNVGSGQFLIETFQSPYASTKIATLVAGYEKADTTNAANALTANTAIDLSVGKKYIGNTAGAISIA